MEKINRSGSTPKQTNNYDCGVFTLINLALLAHGHTLSRTIFTQGTIYTNQSRRQLAHVILLHSKMTLPPQLIGGRRNTATMGQSKALIRKVASPCNGAIKTKGKRLYRRHRRDKAKIILGGKRVSHIII